MLVVFQSNKEYHRQSVVVIQKDTCPIIISVHEHGLFSITASTTVKQFFADNSLFRKWGNFTHMLKSYDFSAKISVLMCNSFYNWESFLDGVQRHDSLLLVSHVAAPSFSSFPVWLLEMRTATKIHWFWWYVCFDVKSKRHLRDARDPVLNRPVFRGWGASYARSGWLNSGDVCLIVL